MSKEKIFNGTQGITLVLLNKLSLPANLVFELIRFITDPKKLVMRINGHKKTCSKAGLFEDQSQVFPCFHCGGSQLLTNQT